MGVNFRHRLLTDVTPEIEWLYLINETYIGEVCIIPLLQNIISNYELSTPLRDTLNRQIDEEVEHALLYKSILKNSFSHGSMYPKEFSIYFDGIDQLTLKLYALSFLEIQSLIGK